LETYEGNNLKENQEKYTNKNERAIVQNQENKMDRLTPIRL
jgi:hypothetical protein